MGDFSPPAGTPSQNLAGLSVSHSRGVAGGTVRLLLGLMAAKPLDFALYLILARHLGVEDFGRYTFALSFTLLFGVLADLGVSPVIAREISRAPHRTRELLQDALAVKLALGILTVAAALGAALVTRAPAQTTVLIAFFAASMVINSTALLFESLLKTAGRAGAAGLSVAIQSATALAVGAALIRGGLGPLGGACAYLLAAMVHLGVAVARGRDLLVRGERGQPGVVVPELRHRLARLLRESLPLAVSSAFISLYFRADSVMLQTIQGGRAAGLYGSVYRLFEAIMIVSAAYRSVVFPIMARVADGPRESLAVLCRKSIRVLVIFTVGIAVFFTFQARVVVTWLFGAPYAEAAPALAILLWALPGAFMADTLLHALTAQRRQVAGTRVTAVVVVFNIALNLFLIPRLSFIGAAVSTAMSETLCFTLLLLALRRSLPDVSFPRAAWPALIAGGVAALALTAASRWVPAQPGWLPVMAAVAGAAYLLPLIALRVVGRGEARLLLGLVSVRGGAPSGGSPSGGSGPA